MLGKLGTILKEHDNNKKYLIHGENLEDAIKKLIAATGVNCIEVTKNPEDGLFDGPIVQRTITVGKDPISYFIEDLAPAIQIVISQRPPVSFKDALRRGFYFQCKSHDAFISLAGSSFVNLDKLYIDEKCDPRLLDDVLRSVAESRYTKNIKIVFTNNVKVVPLFTTKEGHDRIMSRVREMSSLLIS